MEDHFKRLSELLGEIVDLGEAAALLGWDQETYMPPGATQDRSMQLATLNKIVHEKFTSDEIGELIEKLKSEMSSVDPDSDEARLVKNVSREYDKQRKVPSNWVAEFSRVTSLAQEAWKKARQRSEFALFQPDLIKVLELRRQYAHYFAPYDHIYDPLLDDFEPGMKTADVKKVFAELRPKQVELVQAIMDSQYPVDDSVLHQEFDEQKQWDFGLEVIKAFGFNFDRGRQDKSTHPFTTSFGSNDVRITTRLKPDFLSVGLFGTLHEAGHGIYEQGFSSRLSRTPLANGASLAIHESQSRMWENLVGRNRPFWIGFYPRLQEYFPDQLGEVDLETFYRAINKVERSLIRTEADEVTYNLHIMLRFELELALIEQTLDVADLPQVWNTKMEEYLGITPPNDADGVLQDIHWSFGIFGYFSTYCLGNLIAGMLWENILSDIPDLEKQFERGKFDALWNWLNQKILQHGAKFEPAELIKRATGSELSAEPYVQYLNTKYGEIYQF
ncbi:MAG: carboxypeptidase [Chloroflexi bacterium RBG_16_48_8]|nr:MAG: carboxypeptidase [Chloroflexi bacterium RBG_16_48_8]